MICETFPKWYIREIQAVYIRSFNSSDADICHCRLVLRKGSDFFKNFKIGSLSERLCNFIWLIRNFQTFILEDQFFNFSKYVFDKHHTTANESDTSLLPFVVISPEIPSSDEYVLLDQIMSAINKPKGQYTLLCDREKVSHFFNTQNVEKVTHMICFGEVSQLEGSDINQTFSFKSINALITYSLRELHEEKLSGQTTMRRILWGTLKNWLSSN